MIIAILDEFQKQEKISAGEDYKRTIASMQHPGRLNHPATSPPISKITAPLIDSEEMLVDDEVWLDDDMGLNQKKKQTFFKQAPVNPPKIKRKSKDKNVDLDTDNDKILKKQKVSFNNIQYTLFDQTYLQYLLIFHLTVG